MNELIGDQKVSHPIRPNCKQGKGLLHKNLTRKYSDLYFACIKRWIRWFPSMRSGPTIDNKSAIYKVASDCIFWKVEIIKNACSTFKNASENEIIDNFAHGQYVYLKFNNSLKLMDTTKTLKDALKHNFVLDHPVFVVSDEKLEETSPKFIYDPVFLEFDDNYDTESEE